jgi:hypothetical protein
MTKTATDAFADTYFHNFLLFSNPIGTMSFNSLYEKFRCLEGLSDTWTAYILRQFRRDLKSQSGGRMPYSSPYVTPHGHFRGKDKTFRKAIARFKDIPSGELLPPCKQKLRPAGEHSE